ncbi:lasso RiPP family leader peptide-containing protein [Streptomyces sp. NPDC039022]
MQDVQEAAEYESPEVVEVGDFTELTLGHGTYGSDGNGGHLPPWW